MKNKTILILGIGQIGEACAIRALKESPKKIIAHALTQKEAEAAVNNIKKLSDSTGINIIPSWGNALVTKELMHIDTDSLHGNKEIRKILINYYYSFLNKDLIKKSSLYYLIKKWKPNYIIDGINTATVVGYQEDPYSLPRKILSEKKQDWQDSTNNLLVSNITPIIIRFTQALKQAISDFNIECYTKISTTGLGGMGNNLFYTHGDVNEPGMSSGILGKVAAAGIIHQLFLSLSHTPGYNIKVVVPAALVGWQGVKYGKFRSHGKNLSLVDSTKLIDLSKTKTIKPQYCKKVKNYLKIPYVDSGENCAYSLGEMSAITSLGQMECVTREEIAQAVIESIFGSTKHDILTAMDLASLGPSHIAAVQRKEILEKMQKFEKEKGTLSIATNNLGPTVSKHLFELFMIMKVCNNSIHKCIEYKTDILTKKINKFLYQDKNIRSQIISLGLPILFESNKAIIGEYYFVPNPTHDNIVSRNKIDLWASCGWVDIRSKQIKYWQTILKNIDREINMLEKNNVVVLDRNIQNIRSGDIGEILGFAYSILGGERKVNFF